MDKLGNYNFDISNEFYMTRLGLDGLPVAGAHVVMEGNSLLTSQKLFLTNKFFNLSFLLYLRSLLNPIDTL